MQIQMYDDGFEAFLEDLGQEYDLDRSDFDEILLSDDEAYSRHVDLG